ncbi:hypothetical protein AQUCO_06600002v1 [Aquilegia coerulea]|uniref:Rab3GAP catalytic subunit conserved domain-containing protein n=1 Tax=Aquilegia coerulea TaxID=218851 RepID=A0A2G5CD84_AQUCA|nr:hypothetical protein AQUCO_06600002v1 [Aquilegia coerulea]
METSTSSSLVSKARTAFHSAAAIAEKVLTDLKIDHHHREESEEQSHKLDSPSEKSDDGELYNNNSSSNDFKHSRWKPATLGKQHDWQDRLRKIRRGKKEIEEQEREKEKEKAKTFNLISDFLDGDETKSQTDLLTVKVSEKDSPAKDEELIVSNMDTIPPAVIIKQLATAMESGKKVNSLKDLLTSSRDSSPVRERGALSFSAMKSLVLREKEDKLTSEFCDDEELLALIQSLFDPEGHFPRRNYGSGSAIASLPREIHGAPPEGFVVRLSEIIGSFKTLRKMALFWCQVVTELRRLWSAEQPVPHVPLDESPDLNSCLLHQQLQVINCCISRKRRRAVASETLYSIMKDAGPDAEESTFSPGPVSSNSKLYAKVSSGDLVLRLGVDQPSDKLTMLETGEPVYSPITQEGPILTEDLIKEAEEFVLRTGSCGAGCSQLLSDMQAFKAANPGCILEDFVRWHSPPDWSGNDPINETEDSYSFPDSASKRGQLSSRMQKEGQMLSFQMVIYGVNCGKHPNHYQPLNKYLSLTRIWQWKAS